MKRFVYGIIGSLCYPTVLLIQHFISNKELSIGLCGIVVGICLTCLIHFWIVGE